MCDIRALTTIIQVTSKVIDRSTQYITTLLMMMIITFQYCSKMPECAIIKKLKINNNTNNDITMQYTIISGDINVCRPL